MADGRDLSQLTNLIKKQYTDLLCLDRDNRLLNDI